MPLLGGKNNKFKVDPPKIRIEQVTIQRPAAKPKPRTVQTTIANGLVSRPSPHGRLPSRPTIRQKSQSPYPSSADEKRQDHRKRKVAGSSSLRKSPVGERIAFDKDSDNEDDGWMTLETRKRQRQDAVDGDFVDPNRRLKHSRAFKERDGGLEFIHATDVASLETKCVPIMGALKEDVAIELQYPSLQPRER